MCWLYPNMGEGINVLPETTELPETARQTLMNKVDRRWSVKFKHWGRSAGDPLTWILARRNNKGQRVYWTIGETELYQLADTVQDAIDQYESHAARKRERR